jgi:hypothetical protein
MISTQRRTSLMILFVAAALLPVAPALAELGRMADSVQADQVRLHAGLRQITLPTHVRHELTLPNGAAVHEYTNAQGQVFAIRWSGPGKPDLRSLLGDHFTIFQAANIGPSGRFGRILRRPPTVNNPDLKITTGGHMGYFWGLAWLPAMVPPGVQPGDLQ